MPDPALMPRAEYAHYLDGKIHQCARIIGKRFYRLASYLDVMKRHELWREVGCDSFEQYLATVDVGLSAAQVNLGIRVVRGLFKKPKIIKKVREALQAIQERAGLPAIDLEQLPASKLDDVLPAVTELVEQGQETEAAELIMLTRSPAEGGLSRSDLQQHLAERGYKRPRARRYLCLRGVLLAQLVETDDKEELFSRFDIILVDPVFVKGGPALQAGPLGDHGIDAATAQAVTELRAAVAALEEALVAEIALDGAGFAQASSRVRAALARLEAERPA